MSSLVPGVEKLLKAIQEAAEMHSKLALHCFADLAAIADLSASALSRGNKLLFCGNGGSAAECQHISTEFVVRLSALRERRALAAISLTTDTSLLTAASNDYGFDKIFSRQVEALGQSGDVLFLLSTSGKSKNLIEAAKTAGDRGIKRIAFLGEAKTPLDEFVDTALHVPSNFGQRVQEAHLLCGHMLVELIEDILLKDPLTAGDKIKV